MMIMMMILRMRMTTILMIIMASSGLGGRWTIDIKYNDDDYEDGIDNNVDDIIIKLWPWWQVDIIVKMITITMMMALVIVTVFIIWQVTEIFSCGWV